LINSLVKEIDEMGTTKLYKKTLTGINLLILISLFLLPGLLYISATNVADVASSINLVNTTQAYNAQKLVISSILTIRNPGPFAVEAGFTSTVEGTQGTHIGINGQKIQIPPDATQHNIPIHIEIDLSKISDEDVKRLAYNQEDFTIVVLASMGLPPITSIDAKATVQLTWLPPIHNFAIGTPSVKEVTSKQITVQMPISFENQSTFFTVAGEATITIFDQSNQQIGGETIKITSEPKTKWNNSVTITLTPPNNIQNLLQEDATIQYRVETKFTLVNYPLTTTETSTFNLEWGALIKNPQIQTNATPLNTTHTKIMAKLNFFNNNHYITINGTIIPRIVNQTGDSWIDQTQQIHVPPNTSAALNFAWVIPNNQLIGGQLRLVLGIQTQFGSTALEVTTLS
jgi:hypothetical protein